MKKLKEKIQQSNMTKTQKAYALLEHITEETLIDQHNKSYVILKDGKYRKILRLGSDKFGKILQAKYHNLTDNTINSSIEFPQNRN